MNDGGGISSAEESGFFCGEGVIAIAFAEGDEVCPEVGVPEFACDDGIFPEGDGGFAVTFFPEDAAVDVADFDIVWIDCEGDFAPMLCGAEVASERDLILIHEGSDEGLMCDVGGEVVIERISVVRLFACLEEFHEASGIGSLQRKIDGGDFVAGAEAVSVFVSEVPLLCMACIPRKEGTACSCNHQDGPSDDANPFGDGVAVMHGEGRRGWVLQITGRLR